VEADRGRVIEMRRSEAVARWWRGDDLDEVFSDDIDDDELHQFAVEVDGVLLGMIQYFEEEDPDYRHASIDLFVDPKFHRHGYGSDAIITLADYLFDQLGHHRMIIDPAASNKAAIDCYTKVGFRPVGVMRSYERQSDGTWSDGLLMEMLATDRFSAPPQH
jgi:aminoglycoside 6'-N-acetyltransferase